MALESAVLVARHSATSVGGNVTSMLSRLVTSVVMSSSRPESGSWFDAADGHGAARIPPRALPRRAHIAWSAWS